MTTTIAKVRGKSTNGDKLTVITKVPIGNDPTGVGNRLVRVTVETDTHAPQCHTNVEVLDPATTKWNSLLWIQSGEMKSYWTYGMAQKPPPGAIDDDAQAALDRGIALLAATYGE